MHLRGKSQGGFCPLSSQLVLPHWQLLLKGERNTSSGIRIKNNSGRASGTSATH